MKTGPAAGDISWNRKADVLRVVVCDARSGELGWLTIPIKELVR